jgi:hypothetical protein
MVYPHDNIFNYDDEAEARGNRGGAYVHWKEPRQPLYR